MTKKLTLWQKKIIKREKELKDRRKTKSFIKKEKLSSRNRIYIVHDNYTRPFKIIANEDGIFIYKNMSKLNEFKFNDKPIKIIKKFIGYWYGFDSTPNKTHGNTILVQISKRKFIFIGFSIKSFTIKDNALDYVSPMGNSDVPLPILIGDKYIYFILDNKYIKRDDMEHSIKIANGEKLYNEFYGNIGTKKGSHKKYTMKSKILVKGF